jgi:hypothetical protein
MSSVSGTPSIKLSPFHITPENKFQRTKGKVALYQYPSIDKNPRV